MTSTEKKLSVFLHPRYTLFMLAVCLLLSVVALPTKALAVDGLTVKYMDWMEYLPDTMQISQINLPGTHDSGTFGVLSVVRSGARTVLESIPDQMEAGIRFFDIRLKIHDEDNSSPYDLKLVHGDFDCYNSNHGYTKLLLSEVLDNANAFVTQHPSEVIILELRAEGDHDERVLTNEKLRQVRDWGNSQYSNVVCYKPGETVPRLGEVRGKVVVLFKESDNPDHGMGTKYEDNYEWYAPNNISAKDKYQYLTNHLKKYTFRQEFCGEGKDKFVDDPKLRNSADENFKPAPVHSPLFIGTNLTSIYSPATAIYADGPEKCWDYLYNTMGISLAWSYYAGFKNVSLNPNKDDRTKHQRTGWWRFDFPQNHQVTDIIESNRIDVNHYKIVLNNTELCSAGDNLIVTVTFDNDGTYTRSFDNPTAGTFDLGYYPTERKITSVTAKIENKYDDEQLNWEIAVGLVSTKNEPADNPNINMRRIDTFEVVRDYDHPEKPLYVKKTIPVKGAWLFKEYTGIIPVVMWDKETHDFLSDVAYLRKAYNWETKLINVLLCRMSNNDKYVKIKKGVAVQPFEEQGYYSFCTGDEFTGYTVYYVEEDVKVTHYAIELGETMVLYPEFDPEKVTFSIVLDNGQKLTKPVSFDPTTGRFDMGYYPGERTITSVDIDLHMDTTKLTYIWTKTYQDVNAPLVTEYRVDAYYPGIGGQEEDPTDIPEIPITGDNTNLPLLAGMLVLSLGALVVLLRRRKVM